MHVRTAASQLHAPAMRHSRPGLLSLGCQRAGILFVHLSLPACADLGRDQGEVSHRQHNHDAPEPLERFITLRGVNNSRVFSVR